MNKIPNDPHILLIRSPFIPPGDVSPEWLRLKSTLRSETRNLQAFDAAMDFMEKVMIHGVDLGAVAASDHIDPVAMLDYLKDLDTVLDSASTGYPPCLFHRHGFAHPGLNHEADLEQFAWDSKGNPYWQYAFSLWQPFDASTPPAWAMIYAESPGQMGPAVTLASAWHSRWPRIPFQLVGPAFVAKGVSETFSGPSGQLPSDIKTGMDVFEKLAAQSVSIAAHRNKHEMDGPGQSDADTPRPLIAEQMPVIVRSVLNEKRNFIAWQWHGGEIDATTKQLYAASRRGIWNHLVLDENSPDGLKDFAAANANIVHSYGYLEDPLSAFSDSVIRFPSASPGYGRTKAMPGRPLWMALKQPALIRTLLSRHDPKSLMRLRVRDNARRLFEAGKHLTYAFKPPAGLPDGYLDEIVRMVEAGGSVNTQFVRHNLERAYLIAYVEEEGVIVGNSSLKHPRDEYIDAVSNQSGIDLHDFLERGYTSVRPEYRGLGVGVKLLEGLTERAGEYKIFSVIAESNVATQKMAIRNRTRRVATFYSQRADKEMSVWIPEWMLPEGIVLPEQPDPNANDSPGKDPS